MHKRSLLLASTVAAMPLAFMAGGKAAATPAEGTTPAPVVPAAPTEASTDKPKGGAGSKPRVDPEITAITTAVPMPARSNNRGSKSAYDFDGLTEVGMSFGVKNKTATQMIAIVNRANRNAMKPKTDEAGNVIFKMTEMKDAAGNVIGSVPTSEPAEMIATKKFFAHAVDPKTDPDGVQTRVFREL